VDHETEFTRKKKKKDNTSAEMILACDW